MVNQVGGQVVVAVRFMYLDCLFHNRSLRLASRSSRYGGARHTNTGAGGRLLRLLIRLRRRLREVLLGDVVFAAGLEHRRVPLVKVVVPHDT